MSLRDQAALIDQFRSQLDYSKAVLTKVNEKSVSVSDAVATISQAYNTFLTDTKLYSLRGPTGAGLTEANIEDNVNAFLTYIGNVAGALVADQGKILAAGKWRMALISDILSQNSMDTIVAIGREAVANVGKRPRLEFGVAGYRKFLVSYKAEGENIKKANENKKALAANPSPTPEQQAEVQAAQTDAPIEEHTGTPDTIGQSSKIKIGAAIAVGAVVLFFGVRWWLKRRNR